MSNDPTQPTPAQADAAEQDRIYRTYFPDDSRVLRDVRPPDPDDPGRTAVIGAHQADDEPPADDYAAYFGEGA